jgi:hypothetical protein
MKNLPNELVKLIYAKLNYEYVPKLALTNKNNYQIYQELKKREKIIMYQSPKQLQELLPQGYRFLKVNDYYMKIINIVQHSYNCIGIIFTNGWILNIIVDDLSKSNITKIYKEYKLIEKIKFMGFIINGPWIIKTNILPGINHKVKKLIF